MATISGAQLLLRSLEAEGTDTVFGLAGTAIFNIFDACLQEKTRLITTRHEASAVHMAEGFARVRRAPAVAVVTEGGGFANALPGLTHAFADGNPVLVISGMPPMKELGRGALQELPQAEMAKPLCKWSALVPSIERLPEFVRTAYRHMRSGRPGPVHLAITVDVLEGLIDEDAAIASIVPSTAQGPTVAPGATPEAVAAILDLLESAERPLIVAGSTAFWSQADDAMLDLAETAGVPVSLRGAARGMLPDSNAMVARSFDALARADVVAIFGARMDLMFVAPIAPTARVVHVYPEPEQVGLNRAVEVGLAADAGAVLAQLAAAAKGRTWPSRADWLGSAHPTAAAPQPPPDGTSPIHPLAVAAALRSFVQPSTIQTWDPGNFTMWLSGHVRVERPGGWLASDQLNMLGVALPYAIGAVAADPAAMAVVLTGDGAFGFTASEMETAVRHGLPVVAVVGNDGGWGLERHFQDGMYGPDRHSGTNLEPARYDLLTAALGGHGEHVTQLEELEPALERAFRAGVAACVNIDVRPDAGPGTKGTVANFTRRYQGHQAAGQ